jgi:hypothetical protein
MVKPQREKTKCFVLVILVKTISSYFVTELLMTCRNTAVNRQTVFFRGMIMYLDREAPTF